MLITILNMIKRLYLFCIRSVFNLNIFCRTIFVKSVSIILLFKVVTYSMINIHKIDYLTFSYSN